MSFKLFAFVPLGLDNRAYVSVSRYFGVRVFPYGSAPKSRLCLAPSIPILPHEGAQGLRNVIRGCSMDLGHLEQAVRNTMGINRGASALAALAGDGNLPVEFKVAAKSLLARSNDAGSGGILSALKQEWA